MILTIPMKPNPEKPSSEDQFETDPRFPSGPWRGFFLMSHWPGRHGMDLNLSFRKGVMTGEGRDRIGEFLIRGKYDCASGKCHWSKRYIGKHDVLYQGYNEGKGIWGLWDIPPEWRGGFHIWPSAMGDPTGSQLVEAADPPVVIVTDSDAEQFGELELEPVGSSLDSW
jgi:hypothetical protein